MRSGFVARAFTPFPTFSVSWGLGGYGGEPLPPPTPPEVKVLLGTAVPGLRGSIERAPGIGNLRSRKLPAAQSVYAPGTKASLAAHRRKK